MFISSKVVIDMSTGAVLHREGFEYAGPIAECKGDSTDQAQMKSQAAFTSSLQQAFQTQFAKQGALMDFLNPKMEQMITNPQGFSPATLAAANSQAINQAATSGQQATVQAQNYAATHGGNALPSGVQQQIAGQIAASTQNAKTNQLNQIQIENGQLQNENMWKGVSALYGDAQLDNPTAFAGSAESR